MSDRSKKLKKLSELEKSLRKRALPTMTSRGDVEGELQFIEREFRELSVAYEQYFMGIEKFEPTRERQILALRLRRLLNSYIPQTDLRFRLQGVTSRFNSYCGYWDRILRLIDEGKYQRHTSRLQRQMDNPPVAPRPASVGSAGDPVDLLYEKLVQAHQDCQLRPPNREQVVSFLAKQQETIKQRFGDKPVDFVVVTEEGKPKIRVRSKG